MAGQVDGIALGLVAAGGLLAYAGLKGYSVPHALQALVRGQAPTVKANPIAGTSSPGAAAPASAVAGNSIAALAMQGNGHCYLYGGAPGTDGTSCWDCSSFCNWVIGHEAGLAIPGYGAGKYDGSVHGPATTEWGVWSGLKTISRKDVQAGDLCIWTGHMGIAVSNTDMMSAHDPADGTSVGPIDGGGDGPLMRYGRLT